VDDIKEEDAWASHIMRMEEGIKKQFLMRNFTAEFQWKNQEKDGRTLSRGMHYRF